MPSLSQPRILIVDDDRNFVAAALKLAELQEFDAVGAYSLEAARGAVRGGRFDLTLIDLGLPDGSGFDLLDDIDMADTGPVAVITGNPSVDSATRAVRKRVLEYFSKPLPVDRFRELLARTAQEWRGRTPTARAVVDGCGELFGRSDAMREVFRCLQLVAPTDATVLISGESGTGKELVARAIHDLSGRRGRLVTVNCGAVSGELLGSHLFGHEKGSFTGAVRQHQGYFEQAEGGTLFLDEIGEMPLPLQVHLLRVLETRSVVRLGGTREQPIDVRVVAATNRSAEQAIADGLLREDLYYRLADFPLPLPPLRERLSDVPGLAELFIDRLNERYGLRRRFSDAALRSLTSYSWPGNVRELRNRVQRAYILCDGDIVDMPSLGASTGGALQETDLSVTFAVGTPFEEMERRMLLKTLAHFKGDKVRTAQALGVSIKTVYNHLARQADTAE